MVTELELVDMRKPEEIDGSSLTINPDEQFTRKRVLTIGEDTRWKRRVPIPELLNFCKFKLGLIKTCEKPSALILNTLSKIKKGREDELSSGFKAALECYGDLIRQAANVDRRKQNGKSKERKYNNSSRTNSTVAKFTKWLLINLELRKGDKIPNNRYSSIVSYYVRHDCIPTYCPLSLLPVLQKYKEEIKKFRSSGCILMKKETKAELVAKPKVPKHTKSKNPVVKPQPETPSISMDLELFIKALKNIGLKEFSIKF